MVKKGFTSIAMLLAAMVVVGLVGLSIQPNIGAYFDRLKVDELIQKEALIKDIFINYYRTHDYNISAMPQTIDELITAAINDKIIPKIDSSSPNVTPADIAHFKSNGFGGEISISLDGAVLNIESNIPDSKPYAKKYYANIMGKLYPSYERAGKIGHKYALAGDMMKHVQLISAMSKKAATAGATLDEQTAKIENKPWWDYNPLTDTYQIKTWNGNGWTVQKTVYANTGSSTNGSGSSNLTTLVGDPNTILASSVAEGTILTNSNGQQFISIDGQWKSFGGGGNTIVGTRSETSASSVSEGTILVEPNSDGTVTRYIAIGGEWYGFAGFNSGGGSLNGGFIEPIFNLPAEIYPKGTYTIIASHPTPDSVSSYQWEYGTNNYSISSLTANPTNITITDASVGDRIIVKLRAISTTGNVSSYISRSATVKMPTPSINISGVTVIGNRVKLSATVLAGDNITPITPDSYEWSVSGGATLSSINTPNPSLQLPNIANTSITVTLKVTKNGQTAVGTKTFTVGDIPEPVINAPSITYKGAQEQLSISNINEFSGTQTYHWTILSGGGSLSDETAPNPVYSVPTDVSSAIIRCEINDMGVTKVKDFSLQIQEMPSINITGYNVTVTDLPFNYSLDKVLLAGTTFIWEKVSGGEITFSNPTTSSTDVTFMQGGTYVIKVKANYKGVIREAQKTIQANPKPVLAVSKTVITMNDSDFTIDADSNDGLVGNDNNNINNETGWEVLMTSSNGQSIIIGNADYYTFTASQISQDFIGTVTIKSRYQLNGNLWSAWSEPVTVTIKPPKPTITIPSAIYYTEPNVLFTANRNGVTGSTIKFTFIGGLVGSQNDNSIYWTAPTFGTATVMVTQIKNGIESDPDGPYNINLVSMNIPSLTTEHYETELSANPKYYYLLAYNKTEISRYFYINFEFQGEGAVSYKWENLTGDETDVTFISSNTQSTKITCQGSGTAKIRITVTHRGVSKYKDEEIECDGYETLEYE